MAVVSLEGFKHATFSHDGAVRGVYSRGEGPGVVVMHEIPGITPEVARFARRVADDGFRVNACARKVAERGFGHEVVAH